MAGSLKDQLLKAGVVDQKKAKKVAHEQRKAKGKQNNQQVADKAKQAQAEKAERDRQLNLQRKEEAERKALEAQVKQIIDSNRLQDTDGDIAYNFTDGTKVKRIYVNPQIQTRLARGSVVVVRHEGGYELLAADAAEKVSARDPSRVIQPQVKEEVTEDDPYAEYQVPDDLMW